MFQNVRPLTVYLYGTGSGNNVPTDTGSSLHMVSNEAVGRHWPAPWLAWLHWAERQLTGDRQVQKLQQTVSTRW